MGKGAMLLVMATMIGGSIMLFQSERTVVKTDERQSERQEEVLAREIARSGYSALVARTRKMEQENPNAELSTLVGLINGQDGYMEGTYQGGRYRARVEQVSASGYTIESVGTYGSASHRLHSLWVSDGTLEAPTTGTPTTNTLASNSDYCSAIFVQRWIPKNNNGHGNNKDGCDMSNPGQTNCFDSDPNVDDEIVKRSNGSKYWKLRTELLLPPASNRSGETEQYSVDVLPGELVNFILAVDADGICQHEGDDDISMDDGAFTYHHAALVEQTGDFGQLHEGSYAMIEPKMGQPGVWRIAFEETPFSEDQLWDVKKNSYGNGWNASAKTYGGRGWTSYDVNGYRILSNYTNRPDFNDQIIEVAIN